jgi:serine protease SohB
MADPSPFEKVPAALRALVPARFRTDIPVVPVVRLAGAIGISSPLKPGLTLANVARLLDRAFSMRHVRAVALSINSPGGAAAQSHLIHRRIRALAEEKKLPVLAFVEDVAASGGYMIACAADEIIADASSIVGSIGVVGATFGFDKLIEKIGVERRLYTSGENKAMLDPFLPEKPEDVERLKALQRDIHQSFIALVQERRGAKLDSRESALFSGAYWTGQRSRELGLVDAVGDLRSVLRERYGDKVRTPLIAEKGFALLGRRLPGAAGLERLGSGASLADDMVATLEARALWSRYGL